MKPTAYFLFFWTLLCFLLHCASEGSEVFCVFMKSCVLPCSFSSGTDLVIHWLKTPDDIPVHTFYHSQNKHQHEDYRGRTSLFVKELSKGNASLLLTKVKVQDQGRYTCFTSTTRNSKQSSINLTVYAPVTEVELQQEEEELKCRSRDIYPEPEVTWTPSTEHNTRVYKIGTGLFSVVSAVRLPHSPPHEHRCNVSTLHGWRSATYRRNSEIQIIEYHTTVPCTVSRAPVKSLVWKFNLTQTIYNKTGSEPVYSESWRQFVDGVSDSNRLVLIHLTKKQLGVYSCVLRTDRETYVINTEISARIVEGLLKYALIVTAIVIVFAFIIGALICRRKRG